MNIRRITLVALSIFLAQTKISAQTVTSGNIGYIEKTADVNFTEIANYEKAHPRPLVRKLPFDEAEENGDRPSPLPVDPSLIRLYDPSIHKSERVHSAYLPVSPTAADTFLAKVSDGTSIPPDVHGGVDSLYAITAINSSVTIQNRYTHAVISSVTIDAFWASVEVHGTSGASYDPRVHYDPHYKRWIMIADCYGQSANSQLNIAVSATSNPTGTWHMYRLPVGSSSGSGKWLDFPCVGFNKRWVAISGNFFQVTGSGSYISDIIYVFDYASLMAGGTLSYQALTPTGTSFTICPAQTYDTTEVNMFCLENYSGGSGKLKLSKISGGAIGSLTLTGITYPTSPRHWDQSNGTGNDFVPQLGGGTSYLLQGNDDRINNVVQRNNKLWTAYSAFLPAGGSASRISAMWWQVDTAGTVDQIGLIDDPTGANFYWFPSVAVNDSNDAIFGFATSSASLHPSCGYSVHMHTDPADSSRPVYIYRHGQKTYFNNFSTTVSTPGYQDRWGDYTQTCIDPVNNHDFFTLQECVPSTSPAAPNSLWDTWWAHVTLCTPLSTVPTQAIYTSSPCTGTSALYSVNTVAGASSYVWTVSGAGWTGTSTTDSIYLIAGTGVATVTVAPANSCSAGTGVLTFTISPSPLPVETLSVTPASICLGATSALFTATATGGPTSYSWTVLGTGWSGSSSTSTLTAVVGTGTGTIIVNGTNGCGVGPNDTLTITPNAGPTLGAITPPSPLCSSSTGVFTVAPVSGVTGYTWTILGTGWSGSSATNSVTATIGTGTGTIIVNGTNACGTGPNDTLIVTSSTGPGAATGITSTTSPLCSGSNAVFTTPALGTATGYTWTVTGTGWSGSSTTNSITVVVGTGVATITVTPVNTCGNGTPFTLTSVVPVITPTATFVESTHVTPDHTNMTITYTGSAPAGTTYTWNFGGGVGTPATGPGPQTVYFNAPGIYTVTLTVDNGGCATRDTGTVHVINGLGVQQVNVNTFEASIIPNPNDGSFNIVFDQPIMHPISVKISDLEGRTVYQNEFANTNDNKLAIVTEHLAPGNYFATILVDGAILAKKITISR